MRSVAFGFVALLAVTFLAAPCDAKGGSGGSSSNSSKSGAVNLTPSVGIAAASAVMAAAIVNRF
ncbi:hypothetical protein IWQ61_000943 [Dispira simplex]|nr:hypothetical protein IWQ61_000943 [Dispira simplex]